MPAKDWKKDLASLLGVDDDIIADATDNMSSDSVQYINVENTQAIEIASTDLDMFAGLAIPEVFKFVFPPVLVAIWRLLRENVDVERLFYRLALGLPRGFAKTTLIKLFVLYCILYTKRKFILLIAETGPKAENLIADVMDMLNESNVVSLFGRWNESCDIDQLALKKFTFRGRTIVIAAIGAGGSVRGLNLKNWRPDVMIFDDIQSRECAESEVQSMTLERWFYATCLKAKSPFGCMFIFVANMYPTKWSMLRRMKKNPTWIKFIAGGILSDGTSLWEDLRPLASLIEELDGDIAAGHPEIFFSEVMNDEEVGTNNRVDFSSIADWPWGDGDFPQGRGIIIDPSGNKLGSDDVTIGLIEVYDGIPGLREIISEQLSPGNTIRRALLMALKYKVRVIGIESTAYQATLAYWFGEIMRPLGITGIEAVEIYTGSVSKNSRIMQMLQSLQKKEIFLHPDVKPIVLGQISSWNPMKRDNDDGTLDILTYIPRMVNEHAHSMMTDTNILLMDAVQGVGVSEDNHMF